MPGKFRLDIREKILNGKGCQAFEKAAQGSGGVAIPGSVLKQVWMQHLGHGLVVVELMVGLDLRSFPAIRIL